MAEMVKEQLIKYLTHAHALEKQALLVNPLGGETPSPTHPETLGDTSPDQQSS